jgi:hypothetical protein
MSSYSGHTSNYCRPSQHQKEEEKEERRRHSMGIPIVTKNIRGERRRRSIASK